MPDKGKRSNNGTIHQHTFDDQTTMTNHAFGPDKTSGLDFSVTPHDGIVSHDRRSPDYRVAPYDGACTNVNRPIYNHAVFNSSSNVL
jgi:hypothetical protein